MSKRKQSFPHTLPADKLQLQLTMIVRIGDQPLNQTCWFLLDPSPIIGNTCHSLTDSHLVNLIDGTLACEDANSKLVEVVSVADVDAEYNVGNNLLQIWELMFGPKAKLLFRL